MAKETKEKQDGMGVPDLLIVISYCLSVLCPKHNPSSQELQPKNKNKGVLKNLSAFALKALTKVTSWKEGSSTQAKGIKLEVVVLIRVCHQIRLQLLGDLMSIYIFWELPAFSILAIPISILNLAEPNCLKTLILL